MKPILHRKESVILTAIEIIDELGIQGLSSREIARRQEISEGTLFKHFRTKNDIILEVLDYYSQFDDQIEESIKLKKLAPIEAIMFGINSLVEYYENYPAITSIMNLYGVLNTDTEMEKKIKLIFDRRTRVLKYLIEEGQQSGVIRKEINSEALTDTIIGFFRLQVLRWRMEKYNFPLKEKILMAMQMILKSHTA